MAGQGSNRNLTPPKFKGWPHLSEIKTHPEKFVNVPNNFFDHYLYFLEMCRIKVLLLFFKLSKLSKSSPGDYFEISIKEIIKETKQNKQTVLVALRYLLKDGFISKIKNNKRGKSLGSNSYKINLDVFLPDKLIIPSKINRKIYKPSSLLTRRIPAVKFKQYPTSHNFDVHRRFLKRLGLSGCPEGYEVDHVIPRFLGGKDRIGNMQLLPIEIHRLKSKEERAEYIRVCTRKIIEGMNQNAEKEK